MPPPRAGPSSSATYEPHSPSIGSGLQRQRPASAAAARSMLLVWSSRWTTGLRAVGIMLAPTGPRSGGKLIAPGPQVEHGGRLDKRERPGARAARGGARGRRGRFRAADRAVPRRAARALLPHARLGPRRGGRAPGRHAAGLARAAEVRGAELAPLVA